jgi:hypothetical protein
MTQPPLIYASKGRGLIRNFMSKALVGGKMISDMRNSNGRPLNAQL